jgi:Xaa-Pro aminopeptidase
MGYEDILQDIPVAEYKERLAKTKAEMASEGLEGLLVYSDSARMSNVRWLANYRAFDGVFPYPAMVFVPLNGDPVLFAEGSLVGYAEEKTWFDDTRGIRQELGNVVRDFAAKHPGAKIGLSGAKYCALEFYEQIMANIGSAKLEKTMLIEQLKSVKSERELRNMKVAADLADKGLWKIKELLEAEKCLTEREVARQAMAEMFRLGADTKSFDIMVQSGINAEKYFLAYPTDKVVKRGEIILVDIGVRFNDYSSDMARGIEYGEMTDKQHMLVETCLKAWETGMAALRPGMTGKEADIAANEVIHNAGYDHSAGEGRGCAHSTGMDPEEEIPTIGPESDDILKVNQTFCFEITLLEPGVGGTRVEDTCVLRTDGVESLTNFPRINKW